MNNQGDIENEGTEPVISGEQTELPENGNLPEGNMGGIPEVGQTQEPVDSAEPEDEKKVEKEKDEKQSKEKEQDKGEKQEQGEEQGEENEGPDEVNTESSAEGTGKQNAGTLQTGLLAVAAFFIGFMLAFLFYRMRKDKVKQDRHIDSGVEERKDMSRSTGQKEAMQESPFENRSESVGNIPVPPDKTAAMIPGGGPDRRHPGIYIGKAHNIGRRGSQQDSFGMSGDRQGMSTKGKGILAIVADGMGGTENGDQVSVIAAVTMLQNFDRMDGAASGESRLLTLMNQANEEVKQFNQAGGGKKGGSTLVSVLIQNGQLYWLTVGDSRLCLYRKNALIQINREHVYGIELDEKAARGEISAYAAANDPQRKALTSYIGMDKITKMDRNIRPLQLEDRDRLLLMSDGVFGTLTDEEITAAMQLPVINSGEAIDQMIQSKNRREQDNYTVLILEYVQE